MEYGMVSILLDFVHFLFEICVIINGLNYYQSFNHQRIIISFIYIHIDSTIIRCYGKNQ